MIDTTITGRLMKALEEAIVHHVDIVLDDDNEWFNELLDRKINERLDDKGVN